MRSPYINFDEHKYNYLGGDQKRIAVKATKLTIKIRARAMKNLRGWLLGGIDVERMLRIKQEIEGRNGR